MNADTRIRRVIKPLVFVLALTPLALLAWKATHGGLGAHPQEFVNRFFGDWALRFLLIALSVTPLRGLTGWNALARFRRMMGLYAFFYACLHVTSYVAVDQFFDWAAIGKDIVKRNYITVGMVTFSLLIPLAATSTDGMLRRLGGPRWKKLHRLVYVAGIAGVFHFYMMVKADVREPLIYAAILAVLLGYRVVQRVKRAAKKPRKAESGAPAL
jgi:sulfoxide reductase heme-binding subunit YedZ